MKKEGESYWLGHRERLRRRASAEGIESLRPHEIVELVLFYAQPRVDLSKVARALVGALGSVEGVMKATREQLLEVPGVTARMADWLLVTGEILAAYTDIRPENQLRIWCFKDMLKFIESRFSDISAPQVWVVYADYDDRLLCHLKLSDSLCWTDSRFSREMVEYALALEAKYVYLLAFTCMEPPEMPPAEVEFLKLMSGAMTAIEVNLMDFILVGEAGIVSMRKSGYMNDIQELPETHHLRERYCGDEEDA